MKNKITEEIIRDNENTNVITVKSESHAFGVPLKAGSLITVGADLGAYSYVALLLADAGGSDSINTAYTRLIEVS